MSFTHRPIVISKSAQAAECELFSTTWMTVLKNKKCGVVRSKLINYGRKIGQLKSVCGIVVHKVSPRSIVLPKAANGG